MKVVDSWCFPDRENHLPEWMATPSNRLMLNGRPAYQGKKQVAFLGLCKRFRVAIDVGSHIGLWTYNLAAAFQTVRCFEPMQEHRDCWTANIAADNVVLYPIALGQHSGYVSMQTNESSSGDTYVRPGSDTGDNGDVRMETLDSFDFNDVDALKIDTEGFEENVLRGAVETLKRCRPVVCVEQKRDHAAKFGLPLKGALAFLRSLGYVQAQELSGDHLMVPVEPH